MPSSGSASASPRPSASGSSSSAAHPAPAISPPTNAKRPRRTHARRSCLSCRQRKARCELPEHSLAVPSSMTPLGEADKCHRCGVLELDCVVWDGSRKRGEGGRMRYGVEAATAQGGSRASPSSGPRPASWSHDGRNIDRDQAGSPSSSTARQVPETTMFAPIMASWTSISREGGGEQALGETSSSRHGSSRWYDGENGARARPQRIGFPSVEERSTATRRGASSNSASPRQGHENSAQAIDGRDTPASPVHGVSTSRPRLRPAVIAPPEPPARATFSYFSGSPMSQLAELLWRQDAYHDRSSIGKARPLGSATKVGWSADPPRTLSDDTPGYETFLLRLFLWCPYLDVEAAMGHVEPSQGVAFLRHVTSYLFLRAGPSRAAALATFPSIASDASQYLLYASCDRHVAQAFLLLAIYEPIELTLPPPEAGRARHFGRLPGGALLSAAQRIAESLVVLGSLKELFRRGDEDDQRHRALQSTSTERRQEAARGSTERDEELDLDMLKEACRDSALWLSHLLLEISGVSIARSRHWTALAVPPFTEEEEEALQLLALAREKVPKDDTYFHASIALLLTRAKLYRRVHQYLFDSRRMGCEPSNLPEADRLAAPFAEQMEELALDCEHELARLPPSKDLDVLTRYLQVESLACQVRPIVIVTSRCLIGDADVEKLDVAKVPPLVQGIGHLVMRHLASLARIAGEQAQKALCILGFVRSERDLDVLRCAPTVPLCSIAMSLAKSLAERMAANMYGWKKVPPGCETVMSALNVGRDALTAAGKGQPDNLLSMTGRMIGGMAASVDAKLRELTRELALARARGMELFNPDPAEAALIDAANRVYTGEEDAQGRKLQKKQPSASEARQTKRQRAGRETSPAADQRPLSSTSLNQLLDAEQGHERGHDALYQPHGGVRHMSHFEGGRGTSSAIHADFHREQPSTASSAESIPGHPSMQSASVSPHIGPAYGGPARQHSQTGHTLPSFGPLMHDVALPIASVGGQDTALLAEWSQLGIDLDVWSSMLQALNPAENGPFWT